MPMLALNAQRPDVYALLTGSLTPEEQQHAQQAITKATENRKEKETKQAKK